MAPRSPYSSPGHRSPGSYGGASPNRRTPTRKTSGTFNELDSCVLDPKGHKEKLPRPLDALSIEAIYSTESEKKGAASPSRTPSNGGGHNSGEKNASRRYLWSTVDAVMLRPAEVASNLPLPLAAVCAPFADGACSESVALAEPGRWGPIRCTRCRSYANPYFQWSSKDSSKLLCNMCGHHTEVPEGFVEEMDRSAQNDEEHLEFVHGSVDYVAPSSVDIGRPQLPSVPTTCFVVESSTSSIRSGLFHAALNAIERMLDHNEPKLQRRVSLVTFDEAVYFYEVTKSGGFRMVTMGDMDDPFVPLSTNAAFVDIGDTFGRECVRGLLRHLQETTDFNLDSNSAAQRNCAVAGSALRVCVDSVVASGGGDVVIFHASTPSSGIGALQREKPEDCKTIQQAAFYEETLAQCIKGGVAVSSIVAPAPSVQVDSQALQWLPWQTGGEVLHLPNFDVHRDSVVLTNHVQHWAEKMQASAYGCVFKLRCSKGLQCESLVAPWPAASSTSDGSAFELPRLSPDVSFAVTIKPEIDYDGEDDVMRRRDDRKRQLFVQAAILYTNGEGERLLRIHTTLISVVFSVRAVYQSVSLAPLMALMLKQAAVLALDRKKSSKLQPKDQLLQLCLQILATYRRHCYTSDIGSQSLVVSKTLSFFPLYILAARKLIYSFNLEDGPRREENLLRILRMPIHSILVALYPRAYALPAPAASENDAGDALACALVDSKNLERAMATPCPAMQEHVAKGPSPAYVIANGFDAWLLRTESGSSLEDEAVVEMQRIAEKARERIQEKLTPSPSLMALGELPGGDRETTWQEKVRLSTLFVEDEGGTEMSYVEWVEFLQGHVMHMLN